MSDTVTDTDEVLTLKDKIIAEVKFFAGLFVFLFFFLTLVWGHYKIPSESMQPTLEVGDHLYVSKFAYGYSRHSLPFGLHKLPFLKPGQVFARLPKRGDVVVFRNPNTDVVMIKRMVGLPGDEIRVKQGRLYINGEIVKRDTQGSFFYKIYHKDENQRYVVNVDHYKEHWPDGLQKGVETHFIYERNDQSGLDNVGSFIVPAGTVFFMGDNRDNSVDSRAIKSLNEKARKESPGFVPLDHLIGRADMMMFSFNRCKKEEGLKCPPFRMMKKL